MTRILHIVGKMDRAGAETMLMNLYRNIDRTQFQFDFVVFSNEKGDFDAEIRELGGSIFPITAGNPVTRMLALRKFLKNSTYQIVHAHMLFSNAFHMLAARRAGVKHRISHSHNTSSRPKGNIVDFLYHNFSRQLITFNSTFFIACGKAAGDFLFPYQDDVLILPNSVDTHHWAKVGINEKEYIRNTFNFNGLKIIQVGRLEPVKNHIFTLKVAEHLKKEGVSFKVFIIGQGSLEMFLKQEVKDRNLEDVVLFLGLRTDIPQLMGGADVMLMPSLHEGFPVVLVESQAVGLPSVISSSIASEVDLGVGLVHFMPQNATPEEWVDTLSNNSLFGTLSVQNRIEQLKAAGFDIQQNAEKLTQIYSSML